MDWKKAQEHLEEYKKGTETVAIFLKESAKKYCLADLLKAPLQTNGKQHPYILELRNFKLIANHLATEETFSVPAHIIDTLDRVIELRIESNLAHKRLGARGPATTESDRGHEYFIRILEEVRATLLPKLELRPVDESANMQELPVKQ